MPEVLFTMRDVESAFFAEGDDKKFGLGKMALAAGGLAATAGLTALAIKNRKGIGQAAGKVGQQVGGYWRKTKSGGQSFVKDMRVGQSSSMSNNVNRGGAAAAEIKGNLATVTRTDAPNNVIPADLRRSNDVPDYLKALTKPKPKPKAGPGFSRSRRILANFSRYS
ncbi:MAG: hypothetical protein HC815_28385 [Richelia sp. RM1_1_1]|nr:hypothetical protein [Richelia sp. RM1_1_1]